MANGHERKIEQRTLDGEFVARYESLGEAFAALGRPRGKLIREACVGTRLHAYGFLWQYQEEPDLEEELWLPHPTLDIKVSDQGRIERPNGQRSFGTLAAFGYRRIGFKSLTGNKSFAVHRLVAEAWHPNPANRTQVDHIDGDKGNNAAWNLRWCSPRENSIHRTHLSLPS